MKTRIKQKLFLALTVLLMSATAIPVAAQVTIGAGEAPEEGALLQLKDKEKVTTDAVTATKGLVLPRVSLSDKTKLYPMLAAGYASTLDATHTGMLVYNMNTTAPFEEGIYTWDGAQWLLVTDETSQTVSRLIIPITGLEITTETITLYGEIQYDKLPPDINEYALLSLVPVVTGDTENFVPENLFFSYSLRREEGSTTTVNNGAGSGKAVWKLKIDNRNIDPAKHADIEEIHILYTARTGEFKPVAVSGSSYVTLTNFN